MTNVTPLAVVILAAGKGTRMKSDLPKVLHRLNGQSLVEHVIQTTQHLKPSDIVLIVGYEAEQVQKTVGPDVLYAHQDEQLGTGHAVMQAEGQLKDHQGNILILYGDMPLITTQTLEQLTQCQANNPGPLSMLTVTADNPRGFGRILRDDNDSVIAIVEEADCTPEQRAINELNVGVYCIQANWLWPNLKKIKVSPKGEYYLTDLVAIAVSQGHRIEAITSTNLIETMGINTPEHLAEAKMAMKNSEQ